MKRFFLLNFLCLVIVTTAFTQFTQGNLLIVRIGNGTAMPDSVPNPVFFDEYTPQGTLVQSIPLPTTENGIHKRLTLTRKNVEEGYAGLSSDGKKIAIAGYNAMVGDIMDPSKALSSTVNRVIGVLHEDGSINTSKFLGAGYFNKGMVRSAVVNDSNVWVTGGNTGIIYTTYNAAGDSTPNVVITTTTRRVLAIYANQLYGSSFGQPKMASIGNGLPTTSGQTVDSLPGLNNNPSSTNPLQYVFTDQDASVPGFDVLYIADAGGIKKFSLVNNLWVFNGSISDNINGITAKMEEGKAVLYFTRKHSSNNFSEFRTITDNNGYNQSFSGTVTTLATSPTNTVFRGISFTPGTDILPIVLDKFSGKAIGEEVQLEWRTLTEINNSHFEVQRSSDGVHFQTIGNVQGSGNSTKPVEYEFTDKNPFVNINYYRLKQIDFDGKSNISPIVSVKVNGRGSELSIYANKNKLQVTIHSTVNGTGQLSIIDMSGRKLLQQKLELQKGIQTINVEGSSLPKGMYVATLINPTETVQCKFLK